MTKKATAVRRAEATSEETKARVTICRDPHKVVPPATHPESPKQAIEDFREPGAIDAAKLPDVALEDRVPPLPAQPTDVTPEAK
jgi:hypothetical protein